MRNFNYLRDNWLIATTIRGYITQLDKEISWLFENDDNVIYKESLKIIREFMEKYPRLSEVASLINDDLVNPYSVEYCFKHGKYPEDASSLGMEFEKDLTKIFVLEDELRKVAVNAWRTRLTKFEDIVNGEDFMVVCHSSVNLPGTKEFSNYRTGIYTKQFLSCLLLSDKEFNTFNDVKTLFMVDVDDDNYIASSSYDTVTADFNAPSFETLKEIKDGNDVHFIKVGYTNRIDMGVTTISTPNLIEHFSIKREVEESGEMFNYENLLTNEVIVDRTTTRVKGALLLSNGCDLLLDEYLFFKKNNIQFKGLNKGLYRVKYGLPAYTDKEKGYFCSDS